jgi:hypothetical protein
MTMHSQSKPLVPQADKTAAPSSAKTATKTAVKIGAAILLAASVSACVVAPIGYRHHAQVYPGPVVVQAAPVVVAPPAVVVQPAVRYGYPRYYRY